MSHVRGQWRDRLLTAVKLPAIESNSAQRAASGRERLPLLVHSQPVTELRPRVHRLPRCEPKRVLRLKHARRYSRISGRVWKPLVRRSSKGERCRGNSSVRRRLRSIPRLVRQSPREELLRYHSNSSGRSRLRSVPRLVRRSPRERPWHSLKFRASNRETVRLPRRVLPSARPDRDQDRPWLGQHRKLVPNLEPQLRRRVRHHRLVRNPRTELQQAIRRLKKNVSNRAAIQKGSVRFADDSRNYRIAPTQSEPSVIALTKAAGIGHCPYTSRSSRRKLPPTKTPLKSAGFAWLCSRAIHLRSVSVVF